MSLRICTFLHRILRVEISTAASIVRLDVATETGPIATETGNILLLKYFVQSKACAHCSRNIVSTIFGMSFLSFLGHILLELKLTQPQVELEDLA